MPKALPVQAAMRVGYIWKNFGENFSAAGRKMIFSVLLV